jgi:ribonuclease HI
LALGLQSVVITPQDTSNLLQNWDSFCPFQTEKKGKISTLWKVLPKFILLKIWLERNNRLFKELKRSPTEVATKIRAYFGESAPYFFQTKNSSVLELEEEQWLVQFKIQAQGGKKDNNSGQEAWEIRKEKQYFEDWKTKEKKHIFSFDRASKGNPGLAGGGGILESPTRSMKLRFTWGLKTETNNRAEALALWQGLIQAIIHSIQDLVIIGDSRIVIKALIHQSKLKNEKLNNLLKKIQLLLGNFQSYKLYHVLGNLNEKADAEVNKGVLLTAGTMQLNGTVSTVDLP